MPMEEAVVLLGHGAVYHMLLKPSCSARHGIAICRTMIAICRTMIAICRTMIAICRAVLPFVAPVKTVERASLQLADDGPPAAGSTAAYTAYRQEAKTVITEVLATMPQSAVRIIGTVENAILREESRSETRCSIVQRSVHVAEREWHRQIDDLQYSRQTSHHF